MALLDKKETEELVQRMMEAYPDARCALDHGDLDWRNSVRPE